MTWLCFEDIRYNRSGLLITSRTSCNYQFGVFLLNVLGTPFILLYHFLVIYVLPCISATLTSCCCKILFTENGCLTCLRSLQFTDNDFPPGPDSLGPVKTRKKVIWKRCQDIQVESVNGTKNKPTKMNQLFDDGIEPSDICQGQLGDCWLLSALASLSEHPSIIIDAFDTQIFNPRGKYKIRLYNAVTEKFEHIVIDDYVPVDEVSQRPIFTDPRGNELWVMLLEKAFAKFEGSYAAIEGGHPLYAMQCITGDMVAKFNLDPAKGIWRRLEMKVDQKADRSHDVRFFYSTSKGSYNSDAMYDLLATYDSEGCISSACSRGVDRTLETGRGKDGGIVPGHAYTILQVYKPKLTLKSGIRLVKLRNPWGSFEWKGDWGDESPLWDKHKGIQLEMGYLGKAAKDDGIFYMSWDDFLKHFDGVDVCFAARDMSDLQLHVNEDFNVLGPLIGCIIGTIKYWFCCCGCYLLWCSRSSKTAANVGEKD